MQEDIKIYSEEVREVLSSPPKKMIRWGNSIMLGFILVLLMLSYVIKYPDIVTAQVILTTDIPPQKEYARVTGKIDSLFVGNSDSVSNGTQIALIENAAYFNDVMYLKSIIDTIKVDKKSFYFPLNELPLLFLGDIENSFSTFENNYIQYDIYKNSYSYQSELLNNKYTLSQLKIRLQNLLNQKELNQQELALKKKDIIRSKTLLKKGVISAQDFENKELEFLRYERSFKDINISISQIREAISNTNNLKNQSKINNIRQEINLLKSTIQSFDQLKSSIKAWEMKYIFKSKMNGKVSFMKVWNKNQVVNNNDLVFTIVPNDYSKYVAKLQVPILNSGKIMVNQEVILKLNEYPFSENGLLRGKIEKISLVPNNDGLYLIDVSLPDGLKTSYGIELKFKQEMKGRAEIITEDLRLFERVFYQFKQIFSR